jgi:glycine dehydrogenase subunit 2
MEIKFIFDYNEQNENYFEPAYNEINFEKYGIKEIRETQLNLPKVSEISLVRHFTNLSRKNFGVDCGFYPLGSCTMKYNPKINEKIATYENFLLAHPLMDEEYVQGNLELLYEMSEFLKEISGMAEVTFQPSAGAHGEITGILIIKAFHIFNNQKNRKKIIVPDSSHGTNPATASIAGFDVIQIKSNSEGLVDLSELEKVLNSETAALMLTNPNTLGLFEKDILKISEMVHSAGALLYYDGANLNPLFARVKIADMGFDVVHFNLHKSFATPHGGGGPGSGPVAVSENLKQFLPAPLVRKKDEKFFLDYNLKNSIGKVKTFYGNFNVILKAYFYILELGIEGLKKVSELSILNANYLKNKLSKFLSLPYKKNCLHEFVLSGEELKKYGLSTLDLAKRLIDFGYHPPTIYFPLIVDEAIMIEPTETEPKWLLDKFVEDFKYIIEEAKNSPQTLRNAPHSAPVRRLDEISAARNPILTYSEFKNKI